MSDNTVTSPPPLRALLDQHRDHLRTSGLTDETIAAAGIYSVTAGDEAGRLLGWSGPAPAPAIVFPYFDEVGDTVMHILRPDTPRQKDGKSVKYESPIGISPRLYFAPESIMKGSLEDIGRPLFLVEGIKKSLKMVQSSALVISAQGVSVWHDIAVRKETKGRVLHADLNGIPLAGRVVFVVFDGGDTTVNPPVIEAEAQLAKMLLDAGADVRLLRIPHPGGAKMGIDDFLVDKPDATTALFELCMSALVADPLIRARAVADAADPQRAAIELLHDLSFVAALKIGDAAMLDVVAAELQAVAKIKKTSVIEAVESFSNRMRTATQPAPDISTADPQILAEADALLASPDLIQKFLASVAADGLVGEESGALMLLLAGITRKLPEPIHIAVKAASSSGKNFTVRKVMKHLPPEDVEDISEMTPQALLYLPDSLDGKVVIIAEHDGAEKAQYPMRLAMSERELILWVPEKVTDEDGSRIVTQKRKISCSASFITTTTRALLFEDNETRLVELLLDESRAQTSRILDSQAYNAARPPIGIDTERDHRHKVWQEALRQLKRYDVVIPQAQAIRMEMPADRVRARRDLPKVYVIAGALATLFQRQRRIFNNCLFTTDNDVEMARSLTKVLLSAVPAKLKKMGDELSAAFGVREFSPNEATKVLGYSDTSTTSKHLNALLDHDLVEMVTAPRGNTPGRWKMAAATSVLALVGPGAPPPGGSTPPAAAQTAVVQPVTTATSPPTPVGAATPSPPSTQSPQPAAPYNPRAVPKLRYGNGNKQP